LLLLASCAERDTALKRFDIPAQPAAAGLNEFARQADIALVFSYDMAVGARTRPVTGTFTVDEGLGHLLKDTGLNYRILSDHTYAICAEAQCESSALSHGSGERSPAGVPHSDE